MATRTLHACTTASPALRCLHSPPITRVRVIPASSPPLASNDRHTSPAVDPTKFVYTYASSSTTSRHHQSSQCHAFTHACFLPTTNTSSVSTSAPSTHLLPPWHLPSLRPLSSIATSPACSTATTGTSRSPVLSTARASASSLLHHGFDQSGQLCKHCRHTAAPQLLPGCHSCSAALGSCRQ